MIIIRWDVVARAHEFVAQMTKMSLNIPEKVRVNITIQNIKRLYVTA